jgi:hypothetical protein
MSVRISTSKRCSIRLNLKLGGRMSWLRNLCLFTHSGVQHILCCGFVFSLFILCTLCCQFLWIIHFDCPFGILLTFIYNKAPKNLTKYIVNFTNTCNYYTYILFMYLFWYIKSAIVLFMSWCNKVKIINIHVYCYSIDNVVITYFVIYNAVHLLCSLGQYLCWRTVHEDIIHPWPVVSASVLTWFITYLFFLSKFTVP